MGNLAGEDELLLEALENVRSAALLGADRLQGDGTIELEVEGFVDAAHPAFAELLENLIAIPEAEEPREIAAILDVGRKTGESIAGVVSDFALFDGEIPSDRADRIGP